MAEVVPIFPLEYVLLPGLPLPLHIFEPRYRRLVADVTADGGSGAFGVVLGRGSALTPVPGRSATGARHAIAEVGTMAEILENEPYADGRCDLLTVGSRRFRILEVDDLDKPYLQASVEFLDEAEGGIDPAVYARARRLSLRYNQLLAEITGSDRGDELPADGRRASYEIAARLQLTTADRQALLAAPTSGQRLADEVDVLHRELILVGVTRAVPVPTRVLQVQTSAS
ncbi:MAG: LON peptidase substrate-binding domain-containing protein [Actinomycetota bacterium]|nr:LON peptidase substrate-binding domain-containing protein [Actinomycetota bacterium]